MAENGALNRSMRRSMPFVASAKTLAEAAELCGIGERTLTRYMANPEYKRALNEYLDEQESEMLKTLLRRKIKSAIRNDEVREKIRDDPDELTGHRLRAMRDQDAGMLQLRTHEKLMELEQRLEEFISGNHQ